MINSKIPFLKSRFAWFSRAIAWSIILNEKSFELKEIIVKTSPIRQKGDTIKKILGIDKTIKKAPLVSFFDSLGNYKLATNLEKAYLATIPTQIEKDVIELDRRVNLLYSALEGKIMRIFPIPNDVNPHLVNTRFKSLFFISASKAETGFILQTDILSIILCYQIN